MTFYIIICDKLTFKNKIDFNEIEFVYKRELNPDKKTKKFVAYRNKDNNRNSDFTEDEITRIKRYFHLYENKDKSPFDFWSKQYVATVGVSMFFILLLTWLNEKVFHASKLCNFTMGILVVIVATMCFATQIKILYQDHELDVFDVVYYKDNTKIEFIEKLVPDSSNIRELMSIFVFALILFAFQASSMLSTGR